MSYNDYVNTTKQYLKTYRQKKTALTNLKAELQEKSMLQSQEIYAAIAKYGNEPGGGYSELNPVEAEVEKRLKLSKEVYSLLTEVGELSKHLKKLDLALDSIAEDERQMLTYKYIDGYTWATVSDKAYVSERKARYTVCKALQAVAYMLFGDRATDKGEYVFLR